MCFVNNEKTNASNIQKELFKMRDFEYKKFISSLVPNIPEDKIIGIRTPILKKYAKELYKRSYDRADEDFLSKTNEAKEFLSSLPHEYFEENNLHSFLIMQINDFKKCCDLVNCFLPYVDNWAVCDSLRPKCFKSHKKELLPWIEKWISCGEVYAVRFGIQALMLYFLDEEFSSEYFKMVASVKCDDYYVKMMIAWYFATALSKRFDEAYSFLKNSPLEKWVHNKTITKARESYKISREQKELLVKIRI